MTDSTAIPRERVRIFSREGVPLAEFQTSVDRSWLIGEEGRAQFRYPTRKAEVVNDVVLRFGNWLLVENSKLPPWVGVLDPPLEWGTRAVTVSAYTPEHVFSWRRGPLEEKLTGSAGSIFAKLVAWVNEAEQTQLRLGDIWKGGTQREETINPTPLDEDLRRITERSGEEYQFRPVVSPAGRLEVYCDWHEQLGTETPALLLEGKGGGNIESVQTVLTEDGPIINEVFAYGDGETWRSRPSVTVTDTSSIDRYGLRQDGENYQGVTDKKTLEDNGKERLATYKQPLRTFQLTALDVGDTFSYIALGNRLKLRLEGIGFQRGNVGYESTIRVIGMAYDPAKKKKVELVVEEVA